MKITCNAGDMKKALSIAMSAMAPRPAQAALGCVLMDAAEGAVAISACLCLYFSPVLPSTA